MNRPLKIGFIGGAVNSAIGYTHFAASRMDGKWELSAGCFSRHEEQNIHSSKIYGVDTERVYSSWDKMLEKEQGELDAIAVLVPTPLHFDIVRECLNCGIPVICEKTLAMNYDEAKQISDMCIAGKRFLAVTYNYSGYPMVRELKKLIQNNKLGKIIHFQVEMPQESFIRVNDKGEKLVPQNWRLKDGEVPVMYLDLGSHLHHLIHYLTAEKPLEVSANHSSNGWFSGIVDNVSCICNYSNNIQGHMWFSKSAIGHRNGLRVRIYGTVGSAEWVQSFPEELHLAFNDGTKKILDRGGSVEVAQKYTRFKAGHPAGFVEAFANLYGDIADALLLYKDGRDWLTGEVFGAELASEGLKMFEAMVASTIAKKWVNI